MANAEAVAKRYSRNIDILTIRFPTTISATMTWTFSKIENVKMGSREYYRVEKFKFFFITIVRNNTIKQENAAIFKWCNNNVWLHSNLDFVGFFTD